MRLVLASLDPQEIEAVNLEAKAAERAVQAGRLVEATKRAANMRRLMIVQSDSVREIQYRLKIAPDSISLDDVNNTPGYRDGVKLTFVSYGSKELNGGRGGRGGNPQGDADALKAAGIDSVFYVSPDTAHEFLSWRRSLREFAPLLFRE